MIVFRRLNSGANTQIQEFRIIRQDRKEYRIFHRRISANFHMKGFDICVSSWHNPEWKLESGMLKLFLRGTAKHDDFKLIRVGKEHFEVFEALVRAIGRFEHEIVQLPSLEEA